MARTKKKTFALHGLSSSWFKTYGNRVLRRKTKRALQDDPDMAIFPIKQEGVNQWDIRDFRVRSFESLHELKETHPVGRDFYLPWYRFVFK